MAARQVIIAFVLVVGCAGPRPTVGDVAVTASPVPGHERVTATLTNRGGGGTVQIVITLHGATTIRTDRTMEVDADQRLDLWIDVAAPPGEYTAEVRAQYPD